jgi:hypothetical protein
MTYLVRKERLDYTVVDRFHAKDMASAERKAKQWFPEVKLTQDKHFRYGQAGEFLVTILSQA